MISHSGVELGDRVCLALDLENTEGPVMTFGTIAMRGFLAQLFSLGLAPVRYPLIGESFDHAMGVGVIAWFQDGGSQ